MKILTTLAVMIALLTTTASAKTKITLVSQVWENFTNKDGTGGYWEMVDKALGPKYVTEKKLLPWKRAVKLMESKKVDGIVGIYDEHKYIKPPKFHIDVDIVDTIFKASRFPKYKELADMKGSKVAWRRGYEMEFKSKFTFPMTGVPFNAMEAALKKLQKDRIDFIVDYRTDIEPAAKKLGIDLTKDYRIAVAFQGDKVFAGFHDPKITKDFELGFKKLIDSGELYKIYKRWGWDLTGKSWQ